MKSPTDFQCELEWHQGRGELAHALDCYASSRKGLRLHGESSIAADANAAHSASPAPPSTEKPALEGTRLADTNGLSPPALIN